jgi:uncharacterized protein
MQFHNARLFILALLKKALPPTLYYHDVHHTIDVLNAVILIAETENISKSDLLLLKTAALFHDCGFINVYNNHEEEGCRIAREYLPQYNYDKIQIEAICAMIMATKMPQRPHTLLEKILCDADLDYLGRSDFEIIAHKLYKEWLAKDFIQNKTEWNNIQIRFLSSHHYWTNTAIKNRELLKKQHLKALKEMR